MEEKTPCDRRLTLIESHFHKEEQTNIIEETVAVEAARQQKGITQCSSILLFSSSPSMSHYL